MNASFGNSFPADTTETGRAGRQPGVDPRAGALPGRNDLGRVSDTELVRRLERLRGCERKIVVRILRHLHEAERRGIYLRRGYSSLFEFCTEHLKYSRSAAGRRIAAARALGEFPRIEDDLNSGRITLYSLALVARILTPENVSQIIPRIRNRSSRDVEALVSGYRPKEMFRDRIRPVSVLLPESGSSSGPVSPAGDARCGDGVHCGDDHHCNDGTHCGDGTHCNDGIHCGESDRCVDGLHCGETSHGGEDTCAPTPGAGSDRSAELIGDHASGTATANNSGALSGLLFPAGGRMKVLRKYRLEFAADPRFIEKLEKTKALLSTKFPAGIGLEELFELLMDEYIDRHSPEARARRRDSRRKKTDGKAENVTGRRAMQDPRGSSPAHDGSRTTASRADAPRAVPREVRDEVFIRDGGRCTFIGPDGRRCGSRHDLQIDHIIPRALGGDNSPANLRLLCGRHNRLEAERVLGHPLPRRSMRPADGITRRLSRPTGGNTRRSAGPSEGNDHGQAGPKNVNNRRTVGSTDGSDNGSDPGGGKRPNGSEDV